MSELQNLRDRLELLERHVAMLLLDLPQKQLRPGRTHLTAANIIKAVAQDEGVTQRQLVGRDRSQAVSRARFLAIYLVHRATDLSQAEIGRVFGGRGHEMVGYSIGHVEDRRDTEPNFAKRLAEYLERFDPKV
jgi:chromosomal replication initiator protein